MALKFRTNLLLSYGALIVITIAVSALSYYTFRRISRYSRLVEEEWIEMERITNFDMTLADVTSRLRAYRPGMPEEEVGEKNIDECAEKMEEPFLSFAG